MTLNELYDQVTKDNITVDYVRIRGKNGACLRFNAHDYIIINKELATTPTLEKCTLAEEYGHINGNLLYCLGDMNNPCFKQNVDRAELKARRLACKYLISPTELMNAINRGVNSVWELAEHFDVTENYIQEALKYYKQKGWI